MSVEFIDLLDLPELEIACSKKVLFTSDHFHTWVHGDYPGTKGPVHKHTADQQFYCVRGECTFHFPDAPSRKLTPGVLVTIPAGQLYQLDNTGDEYMMSFALARSLLGIRDSLERTKSSPSATTRKTISIRSKHRKRRRPGHEPSREASIVKPLVGGRVLNLASCISREDKNV